MGKRKGASATEVTGQFERNTEEQIEPNTAHRGFRGQTALTAHGRQRRRRRHGITTWHCD